MNVLESGKKNLKEVLDWSKFFYVLSVIAIVVVVLTGLVMAFVAGFGDEGAEKVTLVVTGVLYVLLGAVLVIPVRYLKTIVTTGRAALAADDDTQLDQALLYTKKLCKFYGIYIITAMVVAVLVIIGAVIAAVIAA